MKAGENVMGWANKEDRPSTDKSKWACISPRLSAASLIEAANSYHDLPARVRRAYKDIQPGTWALLTLLPGRTREEDMIHIAWRTMAHNQPSDVMTTSEVAGYFDVT